MPGHLDLVAVSLDELERKASGIATTGGRGHLHTTVPGCVITGSTRRAIVLEATDEGRAYAFFDDAPIEARARPLAVLLHGAESVPDESEAFEPPGDAVAAMGERMQLGKGHFHILNPVCLVNPHQGRWTILFEDAELGLLESVSDERPLADIRYVERLIYARGDGGGQETEDRRQKTEDRRQK
ncbi:MAG: hypothetical protein AB1806_11100 [Acidobacteriota bacterium]